MLTTRPPKPPNFCQTFPNLYFKILYFHLYLFYTLNLYIIFLYFYREETMNVECNVEMTGFGDAAGKGNSNL